MSTMDVFKQAMFSVVRAAELPDETSVEYRTFIAELRAIPRETVKTLIPSAAAGTRTLRVLCEALDWQAAYSLIQFIVATSRRSFYWNNFYTTDCPNSADPDSGTLDVAQAKAALLQVGDTLAREVCDVFHGQQKPYTYTNTLMLIEAVAGWNRTKVLKSFSKHTQIAIKAYGLLPLEHGEEEVLERYVALRESAREGQKFGQLRRSNHAGAIGAALANLAQIAGYPDADRLVWAMEAKIAQEVAVDGHIWQAGDYQIRFNIQGAEANLTVQRDGRALKSIPQDVRSNAVYEKAKEALEQFRAQAKRLRILLENHVASGDLLTLDELSNLLRFPAAIDMLQRLVIYTPDKHFGIFIADKMSVRDLDNVLHPIETSVTLAHSYHLFQEGILGAWQREIVHQRIKQPFKQVFRELYLLTPAEQNTKTYSNRFAGHVISGGIAGRLFPQRGWRAEQIQDAVRPQKVFGSIRAVFSMADYWRYFGADYPVTTDRIFFQSTLLSPVDSRQDEAPTFIPLEEIPPLIFSEVMRDADLVVSVAQTSDEMYLSNEVYEHRGSIIKSLIDDLGLPSVTTEGHFAHVGGKLANYRVHLGSAVIHIEPGHYLCIVPQHWGQTHERLFLPFADERDNKISEVISKILLLSADDQIKDESILRQIRAHPHSS